MPGDLEFGMRRVEIPRVVRVLPCADDHRSAAELTHEDLEARVKAPALPRSDLLVAIQRDRQDEAAEHQRPGVPRSGRSQRCETLTRFVDQRLLFDGRLTFAARDEREPALRGNLVRFVQCAVSWRGPGWPRSTDQPIMSRPL